MTDQIILPSVGSYIQTDGYIGPLQADGKPDIQNTIHINDANASWFNALNAYDLALVRSINKDINGTAELPSNPR